MRRALRSLTFRGKAIIAVGLGLGFGAALSGQRDVLRLAVLLIALTAVSAWVASRTHFRLGAERTVTPAHVPVGTAAQVTLTVTNLARRRTSTLLLREEVAPEIGSPIDRVFEHVEAGGSRSTAYTLTATQRGRFEVGPLEVTALDPFGLARLTRAFRTTQSVLVVPRTHPLQSTVDADRHGRGDSAAAALNSGGDDDIIPREYRPGDDLRRIHWRASARSEDLLVRREEQPWARHATVTVDVPTDTVGGPDSPVETGLSMAASVAVHLLGLGWSLRLDTLDGRCLIQQASGSTGQARVLEALAMVRPAEAPTTADLRTAGDLTVVVVPSSTSALRRLPPVHHRSLAFIVDIDAWGLPGAGAREALDRVRADGWHAAAVTPGGIPRAWQEAINDAVLAGAR
jgi:uncharacterized protein (DUF58 family)